MAPVFLFLYIRRGEPATIPKLDPMTHPLDNRPILRMNGAGNEILVLDLRGLGSRALLFVSIHLFAGLSAIAQAGHAPKDAR